MGTFGVTKNGVTGMGTFGDTRVGGDTIDGALGTPGLGGTQGMGTFGDTKDWGGTPRMGIWGHGCIWDYQGWGHLGSPGMGTFGVTKNGGVTGMGTFGDTGVGGDTRDGDIWGHQRWGGGDGTPRAGIWGQ